MAVVVECAFDPTRLCRGTLCVCQHPAPCLLGGHCVRASALTCGCDVTAAHAIVPLLAQHPLVSRLRSQAGWLRDSLQVRQGARAAAGRRRREEGGRHLHDIESSSQRCLWNYE